MPASAKPQSGKKGSNPLSSVGALANHAAGAASAVKGKGKIVGGIIAALAVLAVVAIVVINSGLFAATDIQIRGSEHVTKHDAIQLIDLPENTSLFNVNPDQITEGLKQNPWVSGVDVQRQFPHTLIITPTERKVIAIAYISSDDLAWAIGDDDTWIAPLSTSVDVDDQGNVITTGEGANTLNGIDAPCARQTLRSRAADRCLGRCRAGFGASGKFQGGQGRPGLRPRILERVPGPGQGYFHALGRGHLGESR